MVAFGPQDITLFYDENIIIALSQNYKPLDIVM